MKIFWITNILFPEAEQLLISSVELKASGGWMLGAAEALQKYYNVELHIATVANIVDELKIVKGKNITYYVLPYGKGNLTYNSDYEPYWKRIQSMLQPDVVHIHGTEYTHGLAYIKACGSKNVVISLQGIKSEISKYYCAGISKCEIRRNITFRDIIKGSILSSQKKFRNSGKCEIELLKSVSNIIGRTSWDKAHAWAINPGAQYFKCNEILRKEFYDGVFWDYFSCKKHSIFLSQGRYPVKGLHQVLKAMPLILRHYPDTSIRVAGGDITKSETFSEKLKLSGYGSYIKSLIKRNNLDGRIIFISNLNAAQMKQEYLNANVFICPSSLENSPNSLGEAQILGTPCLASYVGGIPDMMFGNEGYLYRFEEIEMLAEKVCQIFSDADKQIDMKAIAAHRHDPKVNSDRLYEIYQSIVEA